MDITVLNLHIVTPAGKNPIYPVMLRDEDGITLVDTGMIGQFAELQSALEHEGVQLSDIKRIILTHSDIDHMGNLSALVNAVPEVEIWAHSDEIPYITGKEPMIKFTPERKALLPKPIAELAEQLISQRTEFKISKVLEDGDMLPLQGGIQVIHTPGTPQDISACTSGSNNSCSLRMNCVWSTMNWKVLLHLQHRTCLKHCAA